jgi:hypothetical protein
MNSLQQNCSAMFASWSANEVKYVTGGVDAWLAKIMRLPCGGGEMGFERDRLGR